MALKFRVQERARDPEDRPDGVPDWYDDPDIKPGRSLGELRTRLEQELEREPGHHRDYEHQIVEVKEIVHFRSPPPPNYLYKPLLEEIRPYLPTDEEAQAQALARYNRLAQIKHRDGKVSYLTDGENALMLLAFEAGLIRHAIAADVLTARNYTALAELRLRCLAQGYSLAMALTTKHGT